MSPLLIKIFKDFATIWTTIDPIGNVAIFAGVTASLTAAERHRTALARCDLRHCHPGRSRGSGTNY
jgi:small neutral amino acid transporter SnatA (MarC family)